MPRPRRSFFLCLAAALLAGASVSAAAPKLTPAEQATQAAQAIDSRLVGKNPFSALDVFATADFRSGLAFIPNSRLWCLDWAPYLTCFSPWNTVEHNLQGGTLVTPKNALFAEHFSGKSGSNTLHRGDRLRFVGSGGMLYNRTLRGTPVQVGTTDICVGTFSEGPLPPDVIPAEVLPAGLPADFLPPGTPVIFCNKEKQARVGEVLSFGGCAIIPARAANRAEWTLSGPAFVGDSGSPVFVIVGGHPVLWWLFHSPGSGPSISDNLAGINALLTKGCTLKVADVGGRH